MPIFSNSFFLIVTLFQGLKRRFRHNSKYTYYFSLKICAICKKPKKATLKNNNKNQNFHYSKVWNMFLGYLLMKQGGIVHLKDFLKIIKKWSINKKLSQNFIGILQLIPRKPISTFRIARFWFLLSFFSFKNGFSSSF